MGTYNNNKLDYNLKKNTMRLVNDSGRYTNDNKYDNDDYNTHTDINYDYV